MSKRLERRTSTQSGLEMFLKDVCDVIPEWMDNGKLRYEKLVPTTRFFRDPVNCETYMAFSNVRKEFRVRWAVDMREEGLI